MLLSTEQWGLLLRRFRRLPLTAQIGRAAGGGGLCPPASFATALMVCAPLVAVVEFHAIEYGAVVSSAPTFTPSTLNCTPTTPTLSDALADIVTVPETVAPSAGAVRETV